MASEFHLTPRFDRSLRKLKKRYPKINTDLVSVFTQLEENPEVGVVIPDDFMFASCGSPARTCNEAKAADSDCCIS